MDYLKIKQEAKKLRTTGLSYKLIARQLRISVSSAYLYTKDVPLDQTSKQRLIEASTQGRAAGRRTRLANIQKLSLKLKQSAEQSIQPLLKQCTRETWQLICSMLFWCEGSKPKTMSQLTFTNSDPTLAAFFLISLRQGFLINETKFRVQLHLHEYHDADTQMQFWSKVTAIPLEQFNRPYLKPHTGKRQRIDYPGCASIRYHDAKIAKLIKFTYTATAQQFIGGW